MREIVICEDVEIERNLLNTVLRQQFHEINEEVRILEYESGEAFVADVEEAFACAVGLALVIRIQKLKET